MWKAKALTLDSRCNVYSVSSGARPRGQDCREGRKEGSERRATQTGSCIYLSAVTKACRSQIREPGSTLNVSCDSDEKVLCRGGVGSNKEQILCYCTAVDFSGVCSFSEDFFCF